MFLSKRKRILMVLLSILVPVSLLITFRLTGILLEPPTPETHTVEAVTWNLIRPSKLIGINERLKNSYVDDVASVDFTILISDYAEDSGFWNGHDVVLSKIYVDMSVNQGFIESVIVNFTEVDNNAFVDISEDLDNRFAWVLVNLKVAKIDDGWDVVYGRNAYMKALSIDQPKKAYLEFRTDWMFNDKNVVDHPLKITLEATYSNGTTYRKLDMPIRLGVLAD